MEFALDGVANVVDGETEDGEEIRGRRPGIGSSHLGFYGLVVVVSKKNKSY